MAILSSVVGGIFAAIQLSNVIEAIFTLIVAGLVFWLLWWLIGYCGLPEPFNKIATVLLAVLAVFVCIGVIMNLAGHPIFTW